MPKEIKLDFDETHIGQRLDQTLTSLLSPDLSRARVQDIIKKGHVKAAGKAITQVSYKPKTTMSVTVIVPDPEPSEIMAEKIALDILYEDDDLLIINKPAGLVVHPGAGNRDGTLVNALLHHCRDSLSGIGGVERPGIVHRLDKETSGLMIVAKNDKAHRHLSAQLSDRSLKRTYWAYVWGAVVPPAGRIETLYGRAPNQRIKMAVLREGGKEAITDYKTLQTYYDGLYSLVECKLQTGRTHQIRVHMAHLGYPLVGEPLYGMPTSYVQAVIKKADLEEDRRASLQNLKRQALHAKAIEFIHPKTGVLKKFESPLPADLNFLE
ncbi:MAG: RNA pseudouridine synthase [Micavibrio sp.]|nr:RNA pseudouridine synthase [Micavibrio sp.]|tara:strand:+ start:3661 stop:4629 length:969 start_codon:yes stop_codon:yes gene_type:complete